MVIRLRGQASVDQRDPPAVDDRWQSAPHGDTDNMSPACMFRHAEDTRRLAHRATERFLAPRAR